MNAKVLPRLPDAIREHVHVDVDDQVIYLSDIKAEAGPFLHWRSKLRLAGHALTERVIPAAEFDRQFRQSSRVIQGEGTSHVQQSMLRLIREAARLQSSDIHMTLTSRHAEVEFRTNGDIERRGAVEHDAAASMMAATMNTLISDGAKGNKPNEIQNGRISNPAFLPGGLSSVRVAASPMAHGGRLMSFRLLYKDAGTVEGSMRERLVALGLDPRQAEAVATIMAKPQGAMILSGTTGSGKSTTAKHVLESEKSERPERNVLSVEDPAEYVMTDKGIKQLSVPDTLNDEERREAFHERLRAALRLDPDLLNVGEVRDRITLGMVIEASQSGHNVLTTLHASSPLGILKRAEVILKSAENPEPLRVLADPEVTAGLAYQKLAKRVCPICALSLGDLPTSVGEGILERLSAVVEPDHAGKLRFINPQGCEACGHTGVHGRTLLAEVCNVDSVMLELLLSHGYAAAERYWRDELGGITLQAHAAHKALAGDIDLLATERLIGPIDGREKAEARRSRVLGAMEGGA